jgi:phosphoenolpyruvate-protein kinase (PTS system EI component)
LLELDGPTVLVLQSPMTKWMPWPAEVVAIASKRGGALCASATIARERRIPAVFGLGEPLDTRIDGLTVEVDGCQGTLSLLCDDLQTAVWRHVGLMPAREFPA